MAERMWAGVKDNADDLGLNNGGRLEVMREEPGIGGWGQKSGVLSQPH